MNSHRHSVAAICRLASAWLPGVLVYVIVGSLLSGAAVRASADAVILNSIRYDVFVGRYSVFANFQVQLQRVLDQCGKPVPAVVPAGKQPRGIIGHETRQGIRR